MNLSLARRANPAVWLLAIVGLLLLASAGLGPSSTHAAPGAVDLTFDGTDVAQAQQNFLSTALPGTLTPNGNAVVDAAGSKLNITTSTGDLPPFGSSQDNALAVPYTYTKNDVYTVGARLLKPAFGAPFQSAGIYVAKSSTQYIRFTAGIGSGGERLQLDIFEGKGKVKTTTIPLPPGTFASITQSLDLFLNVDHTTNTVSALYRVDSALFNAGTLATSRSFPRWMRQGNSAFAGVITTSRGAQSTVVSYDWFRVTSAPQVAAVVTGTKSVDKDGITQPVLAGDTLKYTIFVQNNGPAIAVKVVDPIPVDTVYVAGSVATNPTTTLATYDTPTNRILWQGTLAQNGSVTISFSVKINQVLQSATIANTASVTSGASTLPTLLSAQTIVGGTPDLTDSSYTASPAAVAPNGTVTYTLSLLNSGTGSANSPTALLLVPAGTTLVGNSATASRGKLSVDPSFTQISWSDAAPLTNTDPPATISFAVKVGAGFANGAPIVSQATMQAAGMLPNIETAQAIFSAPATVVGSKSVDKAVANRGDTLTYAIVVKNNGQAPATSLQVVDPLPQDTTYVDASLTTPMTGTATIDPTKRTVTWSIPSLAPGASDTITMSVTINQLLHSATILNNAVLTTPQDTVKQTLLSASTIVQGAADLSSSIYTAHPGQISLGGTVTYTLTLLNNGTGAATNATAQLTIPAGGALVANSASATGGTLSVNPALNTISWTAGGSLPIGSVVNITFRVKAMNTASSGYASKATLLADGNAPIDKTATAGFFQAAPDGRTIYIAITRR